MLFRAFLHCPPVFFYNLTSFPKNRKLSQERLSNMLQLFPDASQKPKKDSTSSENKIWIKPSNLVFNFLCMNMFYKKESLKYSKNSNLNPFTITIKLMNLEENILNNKNAKLENFNNIFFNNIRDPFIKFTFLF